MKSSTTGTSIAVFGLNSMVANAMPASTSRLSRSKRQPATMPAATSGTTWPTFTACITHHGEGRHQNHASRHGVYTAEHNISPVLLPLPVSIHYLTKRVTSPVAASSGSLGLWPALAAVAILVAHLPSFVHRLLDGDEAIYGSIAVLMNMGGGLYAYGGVDN